MKKWNLYGGAALFAAFLATGGLLVANVSDSSDAYLHLSGRAGHIYLLLIAMLNVVYGYLPMRKSRLAACSRLLMLAGGVCAAVGFYVETGASVEQRMIMPTAVGLAFLSILLMMVAIPNDKKTV